MMTGEKGFAIGAGQLLDTRALALSRHAVSGKCA
jgi:hypothetical protein